LTAVATLLRLLSGARGRAPGLNAAQRLLRKPCYRTLEMLFPRGVFMRLGGGENVRLHLRSRSDSLTFTPGAHAIGIENNFSMCPHVQSTPGADRPYTRHRAVAR
jgi:hypothetical protein